MKSLTLATVGLSLVITSLVSGATGQIRTEPTGKLFFEGDIVRHRLDGLQGPFCVLQSQFKRGEAVAFRMRIFTPDSKVADDKVVKNVEVELGNGQKLPMHFARKGMPPKNFDAFWSTHWDIPKDFPTGSLGYKIHATTADGTVVTWQPITRDASQLAIIPGDVAMVPKN